MSANVRTEMHASGSPERWLADQVDPGRVARSFLNQRGLELLDSAATVGTGVAEGAGIILASMIPFVGEAMDVDAALDPNAGRLTRLAATASLFGNLLTAGLAPNASAVTRAERRVADAVDAASQTAAGPGLQQRVRELHMVLDPRAQRARTTAITEAVGPGGAVTRIVTSSERRLSPVQRRALAAGEVEGVGAGHAEVTGIAAARELGLTPTQTVASRPICPTCASALDSQGVVAASPLRR
jgi:hypothetical protein